MKAAIITYHRALNYGSALQAYALNYYLRTKGVEAYTIDYSSEGQRATYTFYEKGHGIMTLARNTFTFLYRKSLLKKRQRFEKFITYNIPLIGTEVFANKKIQDEMDVFICGSDQIWNGNTIDFTPHYLLDFVIDNDKCCSYAPSIGTLQQTQATQEAYRKHIKRFRQISVRESSGSSYLSQIIDEDVETVLDPVFLLDGEEWRRVASSECEKEGDYVLCYFIGDVKGMREFALRLGEFYRCRIYVILLNLRDVFCFKRKALYEAGPAEFVNLIDHARCVCTNSFHAISFSIILKKDFWVFVNNKKITSTEVHPQTKIIDLAESVGLSDRVLDPDEWQSVELGKPICFQDVYKKLNPLRVRSKEFIQRILENGKSV